MGFSKQTNNGGRGGVTVFSAIILAAILFLNSVLLDWAVVMTAKENLPYKFLLAGNCVLAGFESILFRDYCLMACQEKASAEYLAGYYFTGTAPSLSEKLDGTQAAISDFHYGDMLSVSVFPGELDYMNVQYENSLVDMNVLQKNITDTMQYRTPANLLNYLVEMLELVGSAEKISEGEAFFQEAGELLEELSDGAEKLYRLVEGWSANDISCINGFDNVTAREQTHALLKADGLLLQFVQGASLQEENNKKILQEMQNNCRFLIADLENYKNLHKEAIAAVHSVRVIKERCAPRVANMEAWLKVYVPENEMEAEYAENLERRIAELQSLMSKLDYASALKGMEENLDILENGIVAGYELAEHLDEAEETGIDKALLWEKLEIMQCKAIKSNFKIYTGNSLVDETLVEQDPRASAQSASEMVIDGAGAVAEIEEDLFRTLPSLCETFDTAVLEESSVWQSALVDDYILSYFNTDAGKVRSGFSFLTGEAEYILNGDRCDSDNLKSVQNRILGMRTVLNLQHVLCDKDKMHLARSIGNAIAGALTCGIGGPLFTALVAAGWALGEAALDVKDLKDGKEVPLLKNRENWKLSIAGLTETVIKSDDTDEDAPFTLDYNGYLRILLLMTPQKTKLARIADLIELNLTKQTNTRYYLGDLYTGIRISYRYLIPVPSAARYFLPKQNRKEAAYVIEGEIESCY